MRGRPFEKGTAKGKPKGAKNKVTQTAKEIIIGAIEKQTPSIEPVLEKIKKDNPIEYMKILTKLLDFIVPKKLDMTSDGETIKPFTWVITNESPKKD